MDAVKSNQSKHQRPMLTVETNIADEEDGEDEDDRNISNIMTSAKLIDSTGNYRNDERSNKEVIEEEENMNVEQDGGEKYRKQNKEEHHEIEDEQLVNLKFENHIDKVNMGLYKTKVNNQCGNTNVNYDINSATDKQSISKISYIDKNTSEICFKSTESNLIFESKGANKFVQNIVNNNNNENEHDNTIMVINDIVGHNEQGESDKCQIENDDEHKKLMNMCQTTKVPFPVSVLNLEKIREDDKHFQIKKESLDMYAVDDVYLDPANIFNGSSTNIYVGNEFHKNSVFTISDDSHQSNLSELKTITRNSSRIKTSSESSQSIEETINQANNLDIERKVNRKYSKKRKSKLFDQISGDTTHMSPSSGNSHQTMASCENSRNVLYSTNDSNSKIVNSGVNNKSPLCELNGDIKMNGDYRLKMQEIDEIDTNEEIDTTIQNNAVIEISNEQKRTSKRKRSITFNRKRRNRNKKRKMCSELLDGMEDSSSSTISTLSNSTSISSSSEHQLIIDHPMGEISKVNTLKRRRSSLKSNRTSSPCLKQLNLCDDETENILNAITEQCKEDDMDRRMLLDKSNTNKIVECTETVSLNISDINNELHNEEHSSQKPCNKSPLLGELEEHLTKLCDANLPAIPISSNTKDGFKKPYPPPVGICKPEAIPSDFHTMQVSSYDNVLRTLSISDQQLETSLLHNKSIPQIYEPFGLNKEQNNSSSSQKIYYKCVACSSYHELWNLFFHIKEVHRRYLCLYCLRCLSTAEKLSLHLENKHDLEQNHFNSEEALRESGKKKYGQFGEIGFLLCCTCEHIFSESEAFTDHICSDYLPTCKRKENDPNSQTSNPLLTTIGDSIIPPELVQNTDMMPNPGVHELIPTVSGIDSLKIPNYCDKFNDDSYLLSSIGDVQRTTQEEHLCISSIPPTTPFQDNNSKMVIDEVSLGSGLNSNINFGMVQNTSEYNSPSTNRSSYQCNILNNSVQPASTNEQQLLNETEKLLIVPKLKLKVPIEFQYSVNEVISSSESSVCDERELNDSENEINSGDLQKHHNSEAKIENVIEQTELEQRNLPQAEGYVNTSLSNSPDEEDVHLQLRMTQVLEEIERTKLDIQNTKEQINSFQLRNQENSVYESNINDINVDKINETPIGNQSEIESNMSQQIEEHENDNNTLVECDNKNLNDVPCSDNLAPVPMDIGNFVNETNNSVMNSLDDVDIENAPILECEGVVLANEDTIVVDLQLDRPLDKIESVEFMRICLKAVDHMCLYCHHARRIAVHGKNLVQHMLAKHRFSATVDSITAEELKPETIVTKLINIMPQLDEQYFNSSSYCTIPSETLKSEFNERVFECFQCRFVTTTHKELYLHNRKLHLRKPIMCIMCCSKFYTFCEILCHICPGVSNRTALYTIKYRCYLCVEDNIPSTFRLMTHLRKKHNSCDICMENCHDQSLLSSHVWKHKLNHLCYRCGIAYRNKVDINKHLFWKHGTESIVCKRCLQKRWRYIYHFCTPPTSFSCEICNLCFSKAIYMRVHRRVHIEDFRYACTNCEQKFISRRLLFKHSTIHQNDANEQAEENKNAPDQETPIEANNETATDEKNVLDDKESLVKEKIETKNVENVEEPVKAEDHSDALKELSDIALNEPIKMSEDNEKVGIPSNGMRSLSIASVDQGKSDMKVDEPKPMDTKLSSHKKKKNKRSKEFLDDLNLFAPNLSESGSSDSEDDSRSKCGSDGCFVNKIGLLPLPEPEQEKIEAEEDGNPNNAGIEDVLNIWKNFLQVQAENGKLNETADSEVDYTEDNYPRPENLHVAISDHDYCTLYLPPITAQEKTAEPITETDMLTDMLSPRMRRLSEGSSSSSDSSSSSSSSDSCKSNCSCCSSSSKSSSSSSSSDGSVSSTATNGQRKHHRKKSERDRICKKSSSVSPQKRHNLSEVINVVDGDEHDPEAPLLQPELPPRTPSPKLPLFYESDLETEESDSDEEFYDQFPQNNAFTNALPSVDYYIGENSQPSTPTPADVQALFKPKSKKKKRDRRTNEKPYSNDSLNIFNSEAPALSVDYMSASHLVQSVPSLVQQLVAPCLSESEIMQPLVQMTSSFQPYTNAPMNLPVQTYSHNDILSPTVCIQPQNNLVQNSYAPHPMHPPAGQIAGFGNSVPGRMSDGSSSDIDGNLKRSKRARRPNKFYGYTSDEEPTGQPLYIGMRAIKPQPPPQLVWAKEDLPSPSKSIRKKNKIRNSINSFTPGDSYMSSPLNSAVKKRTKLSSEGKKANKRQIKKKLDVEGNEKNLPPIPTLKIRSSQIHGISLGSTVDAIGSTSPINPKNNLHIPDNYANTNEMDDDDENTSSSSSNSDDDDDDDDDDDTNNINSTISVNGETSNILTDGHSNPTMSNESPPMPIPNTTAFNHKIPPALLPNPDLATLHYFKANNIRYPIRPPAGARQARDGEHVYCYCRCPYDEVSEMIACDGTSCMIEWFHFECVGIMVAPQGRWYCPECRSNFTENLSTSSNHVST